MVNARTESVVCSMLAMQRYSWEQGVCAQALYEAGRSELWIPMAYDAIKRQAEDGRLAILGSTVAVSDPAANGEVCFRAYERTKKSYFLEGARRMLDYLMETAPRTEDGVICHNQESFQPGFSAKQLWIDGLYMVPPFLAVMGLVEEATEQIRGYRKHLLDPETGVFFHICDTDNHRYVRKKRWATGNGWAWLGLVRVLETAMQRNNQGIADELTGYAVSLLDAALKYQGKNGLYHDLMDESDSFLDGTSALMFSAGIYRGVSHGWLDTVYLRHADPAYETMCEQIDDMGILHGVCGCPDFQREGTSAEAQAAFVMADAWKERCDEKRKNPAKKMALGIKPEHT